MRKLQRASNLGSLFRRAGLTIISAVGIFRFLDPTGNVVMQVEALSDGSCLELRK